MAKLGTLGGKQINWQTSKMAASAHVKIIFLPITLLLCHIETWFFLGMGDTVYSGPFVVMLRRPNTSFTLPTVLSRYNWIQLILGYALCMDHKCLRTIDKDSTKNSTMPLPEHQQQRHVCVQLRTQPHRLRQEATNDRTVIVASSIVSVLSDNTLSHPTHLNTISSQLY